MFGKRPIIHSDPTMFWRCLFPAGKKAGRRRWNLPSMWRLACFHPNVREVAFWQTTVAGGQLGKFTSCNPPGFLVQVTFLVQVEVWYLSGLPSNDCLQLSHCEFVSNSTSTWIRGIFDRDSGRLAFSQESWRAAEVSDRKSQHSGGEKFAANGPKNQNRFCRTP